MSTMTRRAFSGLALAMPLLAVPFDKVLASDSALDISSYAGRVVYLDFWASWCGPCRQSFPFMRSLAHRYGPDRLAVVTINVDRTRAAADRFLGQVGGDLPVIYDPVGAIASQYHVNDMPTSIVFDRKGRQRFKHAGFHVNQQDQYLSHVQSLVNEH